MAADGEMDVALAQEEKRYRNEFGTKITVNRMEMLLLQIH
jgi:hypothetical protein